MTSLLSCTGMDKKLFDLVILCFSVDMSRWFFFQFGNFFLMYFFCKYTLQLYRENLLNTIFVNNLPSTGNCEPKFGEFKS